MDKYLIVGMLMLLFAACAAPPEMPSSESTPTQIEDEEEVDYTILAFGDSLTAGFGVEDRESYPAQLEARLLADGYSVDVINGGISGETSSSALSRVDWMLNTQPDIVIVEIGGNDALRGIDLDLTLVNIDSIVEKYTASGAVVIVGGMQIIQNLGDDYVDKFAAIYPAVAEKHDAILIPFFLEGVAADPDLNQDDYIHPTGDGYTLVVEHIYPFVLEAIKYSGQ